MNVTTDLSIISLIANASILVKGVMLLLAAVFWIPGIATWLPQLIG